MCFILASILLSIGTKGAAYGATAMVFIFQIFLGIGYLPIVSTPSAHIYQTNHTLGQPWLYPAEASRTLYLRCAKY